MGPTICIIFCLLQPDALATANNYATECRIIRPSRSDTADTLRQIAVENARCRVAREQAAKK